METPSIHPAGEEIPFLDLDLGPDDHDSKPGQPTAFYPPPNAWGSPREETGALGLVEERDVEEEGVEGDPFGIEARIADIMSIIDHPYLVDRFVDVSRIESDLEGLLNDMITKDSEWASGLDDPTRKQLFETIAKLYTENTISEFIIWLKRNRNSYRIDRRDLNRLMEENWGLHIVYPELHKRLERMIFHEAFASRDAGLEVIETIAA